MANSVVPVRDPKAPPRRPATLSRNVSAVVERDVQVLHDGSMGGVRIEDDVGERRR